MGEPIQAGMSSETRQLLLARLHWHAVLLPDALLERLVDWAGALEDRTRLPGPYGETRA